MLQGQRSHVEEEIPHGEVAVEDRVLRHIAQIGQKCAALRPNVAPTGGMRQRLGIAQAMLSDPKVLVLDEPTAGLDPGERIRFRNLISRFAPGRTILLATHIVPDVEYNAEQDEEHENRSPTEKLGEFVPD